MAFRGGWLNKQFYTDPAEAPLHQADPRHMLADEVDPNQTWGAPPTPAPVDYLVENYVGIEYVVTDTPGVIWDHTPTDSAIGYAGSADPEETDAQNRAEAGVAHATDYGAARQSNYAGQYKPLSFSDERYINPRFETDGPVQLNPLVALRGFNGQGENSVGAEIRKGWVDQSWVDRKLQAPAARVHDQRLQTINTAAVPSDQPPVASPYLSPFTALARAMTRTWQTPMIRRDPPPMDEQIVTDGSQDLYATQDSWVVG